MFLHTFKYDNYIGLDFLLHLDPEITKKTKMY